MPKIPQDKQLHFSVGFIVYCIFSYITPIFAMVIVAITGIYKEIYDYKHQNIHTADAWDAIATIAGGMVAFLAATLINYL
jgi:positive regulator of sigma E activity